MFIVRESRDGVAEKEGFLWLLSEDKIRNVPHRKSDQQGGLSIMIGRHPAEL